MVLKTFTYTKPNIVCFANNTELWKKDCEETADKNSIHTTNKSELHNVGNPDRQELKEITQIILYEWKIIFSESLFTKRRYPGIDVKIKEL